MIRWWYVMRWTKQKLKNFIITGNNITHNIYYISKWIRQIDRKTRAFHCGSNHHTRKSHNLLTFNVSTSFSHHRETTQKRFIHKIRTILATNAIYRSFIKFQKIVLFTSICSIFGMLNHVESSWFNKIFVFVSSFFFSQNQVRKQTKLSFLFKCSFISHSHAFLINKASYPNWTMKQSWW